MSTAPENIIKDRNGQDIHKGDWVTTRPFAVDKEGRKGEVEAIAKDQNEAVYQDIHRHAPRVSLILYHIVRCFSN